MTDENIDSVPQWWHHKTWLWLVQVMVCHMLFANPLLELKTTYNHQMEPLERHFSVNWIKMPRIITNICKLLSNFLSWATSQWVSREYTVTIIRETQHSVFNWGWFNINISSYQYRKSHCGDKMIFQLSYLHNGSSYTGNTTFFILNQGPVSYWRSRA